MKIKSQRFALRSQPRPLHSWQQSSKNLYFIAGSDFMIMNKKRLHFENTYHLSIQLWSTGMEVSNPLVVKACLRWISPLLSIRKIWNISIVSELWKIFLQCKQMAIVTYGAVFILLKGEWENVWFGNYIKFRIENLEVVAKGLRNGSSQHGFQKIK